MPEELNKSDQYNESKPHYLLSENVYTTGSSRASDSLRHAAHSSLHITPCSLLLLQLSHHVVQEHIPARQDHNISVF